jgi:hypothetical protein
MQVGRTVATLPERCELDAPHASFPHFTHNSFAGCAFSGIYNRQAVLLLIDHRLRFWLRGGDMRVVLGAVVLAAGMFSAGCASITKGTNQSVALDTPGVPGATCTLTSEAIGTKIVQTPVSMTLDKSQHNITVNCKKECYQDAIGLIPTSTETMAAGNIIAGGVVGLAVDAATGAMNKYNDSNQIAMIPIPGCKPTGAVGSITPPAAAPVAVAAPGKKEKHL